MLTRVPHVGHVGAMAAAWTRVLGAVALAGPWIPAVAAASETVAGPVCSAPGRGGTFACALCAATSPPWMATGMFGAVAALAVIGVVLAVTLWRRLPVKHTRDWIAIALCGVVGGVVSSAWAVYIAQSLADREVPGRAWLAAPLCAALVLLWGRRETARELT